MSKRHRRDPGPEAGNPRWAWANMDPGEAMWLFYDLPDGHTVKFLLFMRNDGKHWNKPGNVDMWNGDLEKPTLRNPNSTSSILLQDGGVDLWHGWLRDGELVTDSK